MKRKMLYFGLISLMMISTIVPLAILKEPAKADWVPMYEADLTASDIMCTTLPIATNSFEKFKAEVYNDGPDEADVRIKWKFNGITSGSTFIYNLPAFSSAWSNEIQKMWYPDALPRKIEIEALCYNGGWDPHPTDNTYTEWFYATVIED